MFDTALEQILLLCIVTFAVTGILYFLFYPAIVNYRKCRTNNGNIITLTTISTVSNHQNERKRTNNNNNDINSPSINKIEQELDANFQVRDVPKSSRCSTTTVSSTTYDDNNDDIDVSSPPILSIIIPAYDEEERLPTMLHAAYTYLHQDSCPALENLISIVQRRPLSSSHQIRNDTNKMYDIEWIVVNDGSRDQTSLAYERFIQQHTAIPTTTTSSSHTTNVRMQWKLVSFSKNCGKGAAVQAGMMIATGQFRLMVDADGATDFGPGLSVLIQQLQQETMILLEEAAQQPPPPPPSPINETFPYPIIFGSRAHLHQSPSSVSNDSSAPQQKRSVLRSVLMQAFHICVLLLVGSGSSRPNQKRRPPIVDTQCGFKLFPAYIAEQLFSILHLQRWAFDIELVYILQSLLYYDCIEVVVPWKEIDGSKLNTSPYNLAIVALGMLRDMVCVRLCYTLGIWNINTVATITSTVPFESPQPTQQQNTVKKDR